MVETVAILIIMSLSNVPFSQTCHFFLQSTRKISPRKISSLFGFELHESKSQNFYRRECLFFRLFCFSIVSMLFCSLVGMFFVTLGPFWSISALLWHKSAFFVEWQWVCQWFCLKLLSYELWNELNLLFKNTVSQVFLYFMTLEGSHNFLTFSLTFCV